jgi:hypothetical protein
MHAAALRRAARWDGWIGLAVAADGSISMPVSPAQIGTAVERIRSERAALGRAGEPFDVALLGYSEPDAAGIVGEFGAAGVTWWLESLHLMRGPFEALLARIAAGPPRG